MSPNTHRQSAIDRLKSETFDLLVVGGGITGAGVALDATARGLKVALIEKRDYASGTSSKSTKLIHGGLRYLKNMEIGLVREVGKERATVHKLAPHLVRPEKMLLPLIEGGSLGKFTTSMALWVYDFLAQVHGEDKRVMLSKNDTLEKEPLLRDDILKGGGFYAEYRTDDARLTMENINTARVHGALPLNYIEALDFNYNDDGRIAGTNCRDKFTDQEFTIHSRHVINAAGPWVDELRKDDNSMNEKRLFWSKGVHIVLARERFPIKQAVYFDVADGRMLFAIPRLRSTYIGTTDTEYQGDPNNIPTHLEDVQYLLDGTNDLFPGINLTVDDVESNWAGIRPLIYEEGKSASEMSRKDEIFESKSGLLSIAGGKLTGYRKMAERILDRLSRQREALDMEPLPKSSTKEIPLHGGPFQDFEEVLAYEKVVEKLLEKASLCPGRADYLVANYGRQAEQIVQAAENRSEGTDVARLAAAEAAWCIAQEQALFPLDFLNRRSGRLYFDLPSIAPVLDEVLAVFAKEYNYTDAEIASEKLLIAEELRSAYTFESREAIVG
ncbi:MAG: glycerol-3-phosphate dehydrogenase/oxidase [Bacteroidota bacterium]